MSEDGTFDVLPKKEVAVLTKQREKLERFLGGIEDMPRIPDVMFIVDPHKEQIAVKEAQKLHIPIVAMVAFLSSTNLICPASIFLSDLVSARISSGSMPSTLIGS